MQLDLFDEAGWLLDPNGLLQPGLSLVDNELPLRLVVFESFSEDPPGDQGQVGSLAQVCIQVAAQSLLDSGIID